MGAPIPRIRPFAFSSPPSLASSGACLRAPSARPKPGAIPRCGVPAISSPPAEPAAVSSAGVRVRALIRDLDHERRGTLPKRASLLRYGIVLAAGTALGAGASLVPGAPPSAIAGTYRAAICDPGLGADRADARVRRSSRHYRPRASCAKGGPGLAVRHDANRTRAGRWGGWAIHAPGGTTISRLRLSAAGRADSGHVPELLIGPLAGPLSTFSSPGPGLHRIEWSGAPARVLEARLRCRRHPRCGAGRDARVRVKRILATLDDRVAPTMGLAGSLLAAGSRRGTQTLTPFASDLGGGVRRLLLQVDGEPVTAHTVSCRLAGGIALRLRPCPGRASGRFAVATAAAPFRQGPNLVRVCAADYAGTTAANRTCVQRRVRVDNLCPVSGKPGGATLRAHLRGGVRHLTLPRSRKATVSGRLLSSTGRGRDPAAGPESEPGCRFGSSHGGAGEDAGAPARRDRGSARPPWHRMASRRRGPLGWGRVGSSPGSGHRVPWWAL